MLAPDGGLVIELDFQQEGLFVYFEGLFALESSLGQHLLCLSLLSLAGFELADGQIDEGTGGILFQCLSQVLVGYLLLVF